jgi:hypothetical protein
VLPLGRAAPMIAPAPARKQHSPVGLFDAGHASRQVKPRPATGPFQTCRGSLATGAGPHFRSGYTSARAAVRRPVAGALGDRRYAGDRSGYSRSPDTGAELIVRTRPASGAGRTLTDFRKPGAEQPSPSQVGSLHNSPCGHLVIARPGSCSDIAASQHLVSAGRRRLPLVRGCECRQDGPASRCSSCSRAQAGPLSRPVLECQSRSGTRASHPVGLRPVASLTETGSSKPSPVRYGLTSWSSAARICR